jgi:hypothetical protein
MFLFFFFYIFSSIKSESRKAVQILPGDGGDVALVGGQKGVKVSGGVGG